MIVEKTKGITTLNVKVTEGVSVNVITNIEHEFLMTTQEVALGYGVTIHNIRTHKNEKTDEFIEGKHFIKGVSKPYPLKNTQSNQIFWTKRGIVRLGFFIKSARAKLFRDWAEDLIIDKMNGKIKNEKTDFSYNYDLMIDKLKNLDKSNTIRLLKDMKHCEQQSANYMKLFGSYESEFKEAIGCIM